MPFVKSPVKLYVLTLVENISCCPPDIPPGNFPGIVGCCPGKTDASKDVTETATTKTDKTNRNIFQNNFNKKAYNNFFM